MGPLCSLWDLTSTAPLFTLPATLASSSAHTEARLAHPPWPFAPDGSSSWKAGSAEAPVHRRGRQLQCLQHSTPVSFLSLVFLPGFCCYPVSCAIHLFTLFLVHCPQWSLGPPGEANLCSLVPWGPAQCLGQHPPHMEGLNECCLDHRVPPERGAFPHVLRSERKEG